MRILMTTDTVGGVWTYTRELVRGLLQQPDTSICVATVGPLPSPEQVAWLTAQDQSSPRFQFTCMEGELEWQQGNERAYSGYEASLLRAADEFKPGLIHSNQFCFGALPLPIPKVVVAHSDALSWHRAVRGSEAEDSAWLRQYLAIVRAGLAAADAVVAPTAAMLHDLEMGFGIQARGRVIPNGREVKAARGHRKLQAVAAGRIWDAAKGMCVLEDLYSPMPILIAGQTGHRDGSYDSARLRRCVLLGVLPEQVLLNLFCESAVYLSTSLYEPFGLGAVEAALCGCSVVARDIASLREVWGDAALYFENTDGLRSALEALAGDEDLLIRMRKAAGARARERYSRKSMTEAYLRLYGSLMSGKASPGEGGARA